MKVAKRGFLKKGWSMRNNRLLQEQFYTPVKAVRVEGGGGAQQGA